MKVLILYANEAKDFVENLRNEIAEKHGKSAVLRMNSRNRELKKKTIIKHAWHIDACRMMKKADIIVYVLSPNSSSNKNVQWEIKKAISYKKYMVCLSAGKNADISDLVLKNKRLLYRYDKYEKEDTCYAEILNSKDDLHRIISDYDSDRFIKLFNDESSAGKGDDNLEYLIEQYRIFSDTAEALVNRRQNMNSFYISANTALITIGATVFAIFDDKNMLSKMLVVLALSIPGIMLNLSWKRTLQSYFINNKGKMKVLSNIEKRLPASLYDAEWRAMKNKFSKEKYVSFTDSEKKLPLIFIIFFVGIDILVLAFMIFAPLIVPFIDKYFITLK